MKLTQEDQLLKKLKTDLVDAIPTRKLEIMDSVRLIKSGPFTCVKRLLEWIVLDEGQNPLWIKFQVLQSLILE